MPSLGTSPDAASSDRMAPVAAPQDQRERVAALLEVFRQIDGSRSAACQLVSPAGVKAEIPETVFALLEQITEVLARGDAISVVPVGKELTTQQAANLLNISRQYLVRLLDDGRIPHRKTGTHRRLRMQDVLDYKRQRDEERYEGLRELSQMTEDFGGYDTEGGG